MNAQQHGIGSDNILAIDIGSSSTRSELFDADLNPIQDTFTQHVHQLITGVDGKAELDPDQLLDNVVSCIASSIESVKHIDVIGVSCFWHSILGVDVAFNPTTRVLMWADTRAARTVQMLADQMDERAHHQATGTRLHTSYPMAKLRWLNDTQPDTVHRTSRWVSFPEYLQYKLTGMLTVSTSMASGTGLLNRSTLKWDSDALAHAGVSAEQLSALNDDPILLTASDQYPQLQGASWVPAVGDGAANNLGSHAMAANHPAVMVGTSGALRLVTASPLETLPPRLWQYRLDRQNALLGGALSEGGGVIDWLINNLNAPDYTALEQQIASATADGHGLTVLPYLAGERSPNWHSNAVGTIHGMRFDTEPVDIIQATMESIGYSFAAILDDLSPLLESPVEIIATGKALRLNHTWIQMIADITRYPLLLPRKRESSLRGAALHALRQMGGEPPAHDVRADSERFDPQPELTDIYTAARERQADLYRILIESKRL